MMKFEPLTGCIGAQVHDVDLSRNIDARIVNEIRTALIEHQVLVFPKLGAEFGAPGGTWQQTG